MGRGERKKIKMTEKGKKIAVSVIAGIFLSLLYMFIFSMSAQDSEQSGSLSRMISEKCVEIMNQLTGKHWTEVMMQDFAAYFEHPIRKAAHFCEYALMGVSVYIMWRPWIQKRWRLRVLVLLWVFVSAGADEFHQLFVPGRYGSFADVCLDTAGGFCGMNVISLLISGVNRIALRR